MSVKYNVNAQVYMSQRCANSIHEGLLFFLCVFFAVMVILDPRYSCSVVLWH